MDISLNSFTIVVLILIVLQVLGLDRVPNSLGFRRGTAVPDEPREIEFTEKLRSRQPLCSFQGLQWKSNHLSNIQMVGVSQFRIELLDL